MNDNALGAPTEGLGQTVTFANNSKGGPSQAQAFAPSSGRGGIVGGGAAEAPLISVAPPSPPDATLALLMKAGNDILANNVKEARTAAFVSGMHRARAGAAIQDLVKEAPWYTQMFGDTDVVAGARAYTQQTRAQEVVLKLQEDMPNLRKMDVGSFGKELEARVNGAMTGDAETDGNLLTAFGRVLPQISATHVREHYKYANIQMAEDASRSHLVDAKSYQQTAVEQIANGASPEERQASEDSVANNYMMPAGAEPTVWNAMIAQDLMSITQDGNFHTFHALEKAGVVDNLPPALKARVKAAAETDEAQLAGKPIAEPYWRRVSDVERRIRNGGMDSVEAFAALDSIDQEYAATTGSRRPLIGKGKIVTAAGAADDALQRINNSKATQLKKVQDQFDALAAGNAAWDTYSGTTASFGEASLPAKVQEQVIMQRALPLLAKIGQPNPPQIDKLVAKEVPKLVSWANSNGEGLGPARSVLSAGVGSALAKLQQSGGTAGLNEMAAEYNRFLGLSNAFGGSNSAGMAALYDAKTIAAFKQLSATNPIVVNAATVSPIFAHEVELAFSPDQSPHKLDKEQMAEAVTSAKDKFSYFTPEFLGGGVDLSKDKIKRLLNMPEISDAAEVLVTTGNSMPQVMKMAIELGQQKGVFVVGDNVWRDRSQKGKSLYHLFNPKGDKAFGNDPESISRAFKAFMSEQMSEGGYYDTSTASFNASGNGTLHITMVGKDENLHYRETTYDQIGSFMEAKFKADKLKADKLKAEPPGTNDHLGISLKKGQFPKGGPIVTD